VSNWCGFNRSIWLPVDAALRRAARVAFATTHAHTPFSIITIPFAMVETAVFIAIVLSYIPVSMQYAPEAGLIAEAFTPRLRYSGCSLGYQLASVIAGGPAPLSRQRCSPHLWVHGFHLHCRLRRWG
jgi:hypothetical protein